MLGEAKKLGLEALVEVHTMGELYRALDAGAEIIGVNQRNLETLTMNPGVFEVIAPYIPPGIVSVAESGMHSAEQVKHVHALGYKAVLIGEALVRSEFPEKVIAEFQRVGG